MSAPRKSEYEGGMPIRDYWRMQQRRYSQRNRPDLQVRTATKDFLSKKEKLKDQKEGAMKDWQQVELLNDLIEKIKEILK